MRRKLLVATILFYASVCSMTAQTVTAVQILQNMKQRFALVRDYTVTLTLSVDMERMQIPEMVVTLFFKQPDKVHFESKNFSMIPKEAIALNPAQLIDKFDATLMSTEKGAQGPIYRLRLISKPEKGKPVRESYIWVDGTRWVVTRFEATPSESRKLFFDFEYVEIDGKYTLPSRVSGRFDTQPPSDSTAEKMYSPQRVPRKGSVTMVYSDYKVNTNLPDEMFEKKKEEKKK